MPEPRPQLSRTDRIIARVREIPRGWVRTYGDIDPDAPRMVGRVLAQHDRTRAVGAAKGRVPWHRVVRADGSAPIGPEQLERLRREGVPIRGERVDLSRARMPATPATGGARRGVADPASAPSARGRAGRVSHAQAARTLAARDPVIARLLAESGPPRFRRPRESPFSALVQAIVYQQLAGRAAAAIHGRLLAALRADVQPQALLALGDASLRAVGLSANKVASLRDLASKVLDGTVELSPRGLARQSDAEITARLTTVRGIGPWTADMFLMFQLRRLDVWPTGDFGVRRGYGLAWGVPMPSARVLQPLGERYRPYRSVAAWYCWRAVELYAGAADSALTR
jgi:DNA-3-methyladenine glycosylase II